VMCGLAFRMNADSSRRGQESPLDLAQPVYGNGRGLKNPLLSSALNRFVRKCWNYGHNFAFLLDSQAKFP
jgi:hypothetical protein